MPSIRLNDLEDAFQWVSASAPFVNSAFISKTTGGVFYASSEHKMDEPLPEDCEEASLYWAVPHRNDLDLGRALVFEFVEEQLPDQLGAVEGIFRRRGAYGRFKDLLERKGLLDAWYEHERKATVSALLAWAAEEGMPVEPGRRSTAA
jgi:hypothetical protein